MHRLVPRDSGFEDTTSTYSMVAGVWMSVYSLGDFIGLSVGGVLLDTVGFEVTTTCSAGLCLYLEFALDDGRAILQTMSKRGR
ncbi:hypothetical protein DPMN_015459 [Dreissena polymorpha]|uniref:Uncharacterized protein n=1 Tax=Dreissena polymorpha TaxID=45954 RepID=A0A9D4S668_DREPO|nr:hypothetical protein DPMN_015459 [Dreissena polymorpha]